MVIYIMWDYFYYGWKDQMKIKGQMRVRFIAIAVLLTHTQKN